MEIIGVILIAILIICVIVWVTKIPIYIAQSRGVTGSELSTVTCLSWLSLLVGFTWFIALILALIYKPGKWIDKDKGSTNLDLDALEKLFQLKEKGVLSESEYNKERRKLMGEPVEPEVTKEDDNYAALERLHELKKKKILSAEEYEREKRKLLGL